MRSAIIKISKTAAAIIFCMFNTGLIQLAIYGAYNAANNNPEASKFLINYAQLAGYYLLFIFSATAIIIIKTWGPYPKINYITKKYLNNLAGKP